jgi:transformation/transcription domain-associated protein
MAKTYGAWYTGIEILSSSLDNRDDDNSTRGYVFDSLADLYAELAEEDMFYGVWRRRCLHNETNISLSYEQNGMWTHAMSSYEAAQNKVKAGAIPFTDAEYCLWEDHWIMAAEKLQQWYVKIAE